MSSKFFKWTRLCVLMGVLASLLVAMPAQASNSFAAPPRPVLLTPKKGVLVKSLTPPLKWKLNGAHHYRIQIATDSLFLNLVKDEFITEEQISSGVVYAPTVPAGRRLYWRVRGLSATDEASPWSAVWNFKTPLLSPTLVSPTNAEVLTTDRPTLDWNVSSNATQYLLQVSTSKTFASLLLSKTLNAPQTEYSFTKDLPQNRTIYWRVKAKNKLLAGPWSAKWTFKTGNPPTVPVLISPGNGSLVTDFTPLFNWNNSTNPSGTTFLRYELQVDDNDDFSSPEIEETTTPATESQFTAVSDLASETKFYWRVRAINEISAVEHTSAWSARWSFTTSKPAPTGLIVLPNALKPTFDWDDSASAGVTGYTIQISTRADFGTLLINSTSPNSSYTPGSNLPAGKLLYWRVRVNGTNGPSGWSYEEYTTPAP